MQPYTILFRDGGVGGEAEGAEHPVFEIGRDTEVAGAFWAHPTGRGLLRVSTDGRTGVVSITFGLGTTPSLRAQADFAMGVLTLEEVLDRVLSTDDATCSRGLALLGRLAPCETRELYLAWAAGLFHQNADVQVAALCAVGALSVQIEVPMTGTLAAAVDEVREYAEPRVRELADELCASFERLTHRSDPAG